MLQQFHQRAARAHHLRRKLVHLEEAAVQHHDALGRIEHAEALRHVVERGVEAGVALTQRARRGGLGSLA